MPSVSGFMYRLDDKRNLKCRVGGAMRQTRTDCQDRFFTKCRSAQFSTGKPTWTAGGDLSTFPPLF
jgi:hypothetical protein